VNADEFAFGKEFNLLTKKKRNNGQSLLAHLNAFYMGSPVQADDSAFRKAFNLLVLNLIKIVRILIAIGSGTTTKFLYHYTSFIFPDLNLDRIHKL
jgi:hypothetical protein